MKDFLLEVFTEELPPKLLPKMIQILADNFAFELKNSKITFDEIQQFATPRRLAILVKNIAEKQADISINKKGPSIKAHEKAIIGFAKSNSTTIEDLVIEQSDKGDYYYFKAEKKGLNTKGLIANISIQAIKNIPLVRPMYWGDYTEDDFKFIRPVHSLILLLDDEIIPATIFQQTSSNTTTGLRVIQDNIITINCASDYHKIMHNAGIEVDFTIRANNIKQQIQDLTQKHNFELVENNALLAEVCALVESPYAFIASFDAKFLQLPQEVIINSMAEHQKYFALKQNGKLINKFIAISNIALKDMSAIIKGNEKVIKPRLEDAQFFWEVDKQNTLESKLESLKTVLFMQGLGSMFDKAMRIESLSGFIAKQIQAPEDLASRAGKLAKADLVSQMVGEFDSLQGIIGGYYAKFDNENIAVSTAISEHYKPKFAGDSLPSNMVGLCVSVADKIDTICGIFGINKAPSGSKDPYALRRLALGLMRIFIEKQLNIDIKALVQFSIKLHFKDLNNQQNNDLLSQILNFLNERLRNYYQDLGINTSVFLAAIASGSNNPWDLNMRILALDNFSKSANSSELIAINKRINNILKGSEFFPNNNLSHKLEIELNTKIAAIKDDNYQELILDLLALKPTLDDFFNNLIINDVDENIKNVRLTLLQKVADKLSSIGDLTKIA